MLFCAVVSAVWCLGLCTLRKLSEALSLQMQQQQHPTTSPSIIESQPPKMPCLEVSVCY